MKIASGSYTGNGTTQDVTGLGAPADLVIVKTGSLNTQIWTSTMGAASRKPLNGATAITTTESISQHASGFTVGSDTTVNTNATTHYWLAIQDNGVADFQVGSYVGDGNDGRSLTPLDFDPNFLIIASAGADGAVCRFSSMTGDLSCAFSATPVSNLIQSLVTNGWTVGTASNVNNVDARTYYYVALKNTASLCKVLDDGGNRAYLAAATPVDGTVVTGAGFAPDAFVLVKSGASVVACARFKAHTGDQTADIDTGSAVGTDRIQAFAADGFEIGLSTRVQAASTAYHALVLKEGTSGAGAPAGPSLGTLGMLGVGR